MSQAVGDIHDIIEAATGYNAPDILARIEETVWRDIFRNAELSWATADQITEAAKLAVKVIAMRAALKK